MDENKTFADREAELAAELDKETDRRVQRAYKEFQKGVAKEHTKQEAAKRREALTRSQELAAENAKRDLELTRKECRLDICDLISLNEMDSGFRKLIAYEDLIELEDSQERFKILQKRVIDLKHEFQKVVKKQVATECAKFTNQ